MCWVRTIGSFLKKKVCQQFIGKCSKILLSEREKSIAGFRNVKMT